MKVLIAEDHPLYREALSELLKQLDTDIEVEEVANYPDLMERLTQVGLNLDLLLLDLGMPGTDGFEAIEHMRAQLPALPIVVVTASESQANARRALECGAAGYIPKSMPREVMLSALRLVLSGGVYLPPLLVEKGREPRTEAAPRRRRKSAAREAAVLTRRQQDVLKLLSKGRSNKQIARQLGITEGTVKVHVNGVFRALGVRNRTEATLKAQEIGVRDVMD